MHDLRGKGCGGTKEKPGIVLGLDKPRRMLSAGGRIGPKERYIHVVVFKPLSYLVSADCEYDSSVA